MSDKKRRKKITYRTLIERANKLSEVEARRPGTYMPTTAQIREECERIKAERRDRGEW